MLLVKMNWRDTEIKSIKAIQNRDKIDVAPRFYEHLLAEIMLD